MQLFWRNGYRNTSIQQLGKALSLHPGSLYGTFGNKRSLFLQTLERYFERSSSQLSQRLQVGTPLQGIHNFFEHLVKDIVDCDSPAGCLMINTASELAASDPEIRDRLGAMFQSHQEKFRAALEAARHAGEIPAGSDTETQARFLLMAIRGLRLYGQVRQDIDELRGLVEQVLLSLKCG